MADRKLQILISAKDNASNALGKIGNSFKKIAAVGAVGGAALVGGLGAVGFKLLQLGSDAEEMLGKFNIVFGNLGGSVTQQLDEFGNAVGRSTFELQAMASTFQDTLVPMGFTNDAAAELSIGMTKLATDLSSFNNISMDEALQRLQGTLIGNHENALAFGVVINENTLKAELAARGWDQLTGAQLEQAKVQARINLLMDGTAAAQGDAARTSGSWANQMRALQAQLSESATAAGTELLPVLTPLLASLTQMAQDALPRAVTIFQEFAASMADNVGPAVLLINDALTRIGASLGITSDEVTGTDVAMGALKATLDAIVIAIQAVAVGFQLLATAFEKMQEAVQIAIGLWEQIKLIWDLVDGPEKLAAGIQGIAGAMESVIGVGTSFADTLSNLSIPDWLTPGSPTPLELGLRGISDALGQVQQSNTGGALLATPGATTGGSVDGQVSASLAQLDAAARQLTETFGRLNAAGAGRVSASAERGMGAPSRI